MRVAKPLTDSRIRGIKQGDKRQRLCDGGGLYLVTSPKAGARAHQAWECHLLAGISVLHAVPALFDLSFVLASYFLWHRAPGHAPHTSETIPS